MAKKLRSPRLALEDGLIELGGPGIQSQWIWVQTCPRADCDCRSAVVLASRSGKEALVAAAVAAKTLMNSGSGTTNLEERIGDDCAVFELNIDTAETRRVKYGRCLPLTDRFPWLHDVLECLDGEVLEQVARLWYRGKGQEDPEAKSQPPVNVAGWEPGDEVSWQEAYFGVREDYFVIERRTYEAVELYCVMPECDCGRIRVRFDDVEMETPTFVGRVTIDKPGVCILEPDKGSPENLKRLWAAYQKRHPAYHERHARRYARMNEFGRILLAYHAAKSTVKVSRNGSCPCGSGEKYKNCCWQKTFVSRTGST